MKCPHCRRETSLPKRARVAFAGRRITTATVARQFRCTPRVAWWCLRRLVAQGWAQKIDRTVYEVSK